MDYKEVKVICSFVVVFALFTDVNSFSHFRDRIPNGRSIKHPCKVNYMWYGVGHKNPQGGGARNPFGEDFEKYGFEWNECLCRADSDMDGRTNGEELGDPSCQWKPGQQSMNTASTSHPGICEPVNTPECLKQNSFLDCSLDTEFKCDAIKAPGVKNLTLRMSETAVPRKETTYMCQAFNISSDVDSHIIATEPVVGNINVLHHMLLFACDADQEEKAMSTYSSATQCKGMASCTTVIAAWTLGLNGECLMDQIGFRMGKTGKKVVVLQVHWNNAEMRSDFRDSSGLTLYHTTNLRPNDAGVLMTGPLSLQIPPGHLNYEVTGGCAGECVDSVLGGSPMHIVRLIPHMHYLGSNFVFEHIRRGNVLRRIEVAQYFYDSPESIELKEPITVLPGDEIKVVCGFSSKTTTEFTYWGESTSDEMCFGFLLYYPHRDSAARCLGSNDYSVCRFPMNGQLSMSLGGHCNYTEFKDVVSKAVFSMNMMCDNKGIVCRPGCEKAMAVVKSHQCLNSPVSDLVKAFVSRDRTGLGKKVLNMLASCDPKPPMTPQEAKSPSMGKCELAPLPSCTGDGTVACGAVQLTLNLMAFITIFGIFVM